MINNLRLNNVTKLALYKIDEITDQQTLCATL